MKKKKRIIIITIAVLILGISSVYAATIIKSSDVLYDNNKSNGNSNNVQGALDELYSKIGDTCSTSGINKRGTNLIDYITNLAKTDTTNLAYDDTDDKNLRYIGSNPNNYVIFNDEIWRIIGVMNNIKDANEVSESRVKLIRADSIGNIAWDSNNKNDWDSSSLQELLNNGDYYNSYGKYSYNGLKTESKSMITQVIWNLAKIDSNQKKTSEMYKLEKSGALSWTGYVGLMYPSDYGYAADSKCLTTQLNIFTNSSCMNTDWIYKIDDYQWTIISRSSEVTYDIHVSGGLGGDNKEKKRTVRPVVYLNTDVTRIGGTGTGNDPYIISNKIVSSDTFNASPPKLDDEGKLIPVTLSDDGKVTYVNEEDEDWYNYSEKQWANAVILIDSPSKIYKEGDIISESDIESYFVWIPKYKYKLWNTGTASKKAHEIDIVFDTKDTTDIEGVSCKTPMISGESGNCNNGEYMTHPAFISLGVNGFWVGKFETGYKGATSTSSAEVNSSDSSKIIIKPNVYSWRSNTVYNFFVSAYNYERSLDSHMMKNTEWGAVAYLSHSKYGINKEININNNSTYKTGYSSLLTLDQSLFPGTSGNGSSYNQPYNTSIGYLASTTGNITGVYDMSGGNHEYMASYISGNFGSSGFSTTTIANYNAKYFDVYNTSSAMTTYQYRILGDATGEMGPIQGYKDGDGGTRNRNSWYGDESYFVETTFPWFNRSSHYDRGVLTGQFAFGRATGAGIVNSGSRIVLTG